MNPKDAAKAFIAYIQENFDVWDICEGTDGSIRINDFIKRCPRNIQTAVLSLVVRSMDLATLYKFAIIENDKE